MNFVLIRYVIQYHLFKKIAWISPENKKHRRPSICHQNCLRCVLAFSCVEQNREANVKERNAFYNICQKVDVFSAFVIWIHYNNSILDQQFFGNFRHKYLQQQKSFIHFFKREYAVMFQYKLCLRIKRLNKKISMIWCCIPENF